MGADTRGSQWQRLGESLGADALLEHVRCRDVNRQPENRLSLAPEAGHVEEGSARFQIHEEVDVAGRHRLAAGERTEISIWGPGAAAERLAALHREAG